MKKILVTTDLSKASLGAVETAKTIAKSNGAEVVLLCVVEDPSQAAMAYALDFPVLPDPQVQRDLLQRLQRELQSIARSAFGDVPVQTEVLEATGPVHSAVLNFAKDHQIELIVIATHGRTGVKHLLIGSVTERLVRESHCPVLVVPADPGRTTHP